MPLNTSLVKFLNRIKFLTLFLILCLLLFVSIFFAHRFFLIKNIQIVSEKNFSLSNKKELINKSLIFVNKDEIAKKIIKDNYQIKTAMVEKIWPSTLRISTIFYEPCVSMVVNNGFFELSCDGRILKKTKDIPQYLAILNYYQKLNSGSFQTGDWIDYEDLKKALFFIQKLKEINLTALTIDIKGQDMLVFNLIDGKQIIFSNSKDKNTQNYQLELIIKQFKIEGKDFKQIDLRFDKPIITL